jgi:dynein heavy chain
LILAANAYFNFENLTPFERILLIKVLRKECLIKAIQKFIEENLGLKFLNPSLPTLQELYNQSQPQTPIIFILSPGKKKPIPGVLFNI